jgi:hypothetical protein
LYQVVETALVVDVATKNSCNCTSTKQLPTTNSSCNMTTTRMQKTEC